MDIFNTKKVEELEQELENTKRERDRYAETLARVEKDLAELLKTKLQIPDDCTPGPYCVACEFSKTYHYRHYLDRTHSYSHTGILCNKVNICKNFTQKQFNKEN